MIPFPHAIVDTVIAEPSTTSFSAAVSGLGQRCKDSLGYHVGSAIIAQFCNSDGYIDTSNMSLLPPCKRRTCFLQASGLRCISPPWCVVIEFLCGTWDKTAPRRIYVCLALQAARPLLCHWRKVRLRSFSWVLGFVPGIPESGFGPAGCQGCRGGIGAGLGCAGRTVLVWKHGGRRSNQATARWQGGF